MRERSFEVVAEHIGEPQQRDGDVWVFFGEVAQESFDLDERALHVGSGLATALHFFADVIRVALMGAVHVAAVFHNDFAYRAAGSARRREEIHRADHIDLVHRAARSERAVDDEVRM